MKTPKPSCPLGYTNADLERYFGAKIGEPHPLWKQLTGQTGVLCEGRSSKECADNPHGPIAYVSDVMEWAHGQAVSDW